MRFTKHAVLALVLTVALGAATWPGSTSASPSEAAASVRHAPGRVHYYSGDRLIRSLAAARRILPGTPRSFQRYIGKRGARAYRTAPSECRRYAGAGVTAYHGRGYAHGFINQCGGHSEVYRRVRHRWRLIAGTQEFYPCAVLYRNAVPRAVLGRGVVYCNARSGGIRRYRHR